jgi:hypothetical protein
MIALWTDWYEVLAFIWISEPECRWVMAIMIFNLIRRNDGLFELIQ